MSRARRTAQARAGEESGAIIILALAFLIVVLTIAWALIALAFTGSKTLRIYRLERERRYSADAAMQSAVQMLKVTPTLGVSGGSGCAMVYDIQEDTAAGSAIQVFTPGSTLNVTCGPTAGTSSGGVDPVEGGQLVRDVTFKVECKYNSIPAKGTLTCGSGSKTLVLGSARVRYDVDYGIKPTLPNCGPFDVNEPTVNLCNASTVRAVVPKVIFWSLKG